MTFSSFIIQFIGFLLQTVPVAILSIVPFDDNMLPISRRKYTLFFSLGMTVLSFFYAIIASLIYRPNGEHNSQIVLISNIYMTACIAIWITVIALTVRTAASKKLLVIMMMLYYAASLLVAVSFIDAIATPAKRGEVVVMYDLAEIISDSLLVLITALPIVLFLKKKVRFALSHIKGPMLHRSIYYVSFALISFFISVFSLQTFTSTFEFQNKILLMTLGGFIFTDGILFFMLFSEIQLTAQQNEMEDMLRSFDSRYRQITASIEEARRARHDIRHHLNHISTMNHRGEQEALAAYLESYEASFRLLEAEPLCGYPAFDNILRYYIETAEEQGIKVETKLYPLRESLPFDVIDITVMLGNLMENAISACEALSPGDMHFIRVWAKQADAAFLVQIENSCEKGGR